MTEQIKIENIIRNTRRYWYIDGLSEIAGGLIIFLGGFSYYLVSIMNNSALKYILLTVLQPVIIIGGSLLARKILPLIKERLTYPRTGYLTFKRPARNNRWKRIFLVVSVAVATSVLVTFITDALPERLLPFITSCFLMIFSVYLGYQNAVPRFYWTGLFMLLLGAWIAYLNLSGPLPYMYLFTGTGLIWIFSGLVTLILYIRKTRPIVEES